jgi:pyridoxamine 5'-phosphate oxidase
MMMMTMMTATSKKATTTSTTTTSLVPSSSSSSSSSSSWRHLLEISIAKTRKIRGSNYVQLATVDNTNKNPHPFPEPRVRTVVFRGFLKDSLPIIVYPKNQPVPTLSKNDNNHKRDNDTIHDYDTSVSHHPTDGKDDINSNISNNQHHLLTLPCVMQMCTDARSHKVKEVQQQQEQQTYHPHTTPPIAIAEVVWWFPKTSEQYRIRGQLLMIGEHQEQRCNDNDEEDKNNDSDDSDKVRNSRILAIARKQLWGNLSDSARESFFNPQIPGQPWQEETTKIDDDNDDEVKETYEEIVDKREQDSIPQGGRDLDGKLLPPPSNFLLMLLNPTVVDYLCLTGSQYRQIDTRIDNKNNNWLSQRVNP